MSSLVSGIEAGDGLNQKNRCHCTPRIPERVNVKHFSSGPRPR